MVAEHFINMLYKIAKQRPEGFTFNPIKNNFPTNGFVVATDKTQNCIGKVGLVKVILFYLSNYDYCIGGWRNEDGTMQFDASKVYLNVEDAINAARDNGQRAIYDLHSGKAIMACDYNNYTSCAIAA